MKKNYLKQGKKITKIKKPQKYWPLITLVIGIVLMVFLDVLGSFGKDESVFILLLPILLLIIFNTVFTIICLFKRKSWFLVPAIILLLLHYSVIAFTVYESSHPY